jgi:hypothetical protein
MYTKNVMVVLSLMATSLIFTEILSSSAQREFEAVMEKFDKPAPEQPDVRSEMNRIATAIAPAAIDASLIPRNLLDRDRMERQIRGHLMNQLGYGWTVEARHVCIDVIACFLTTLDGAIVGVARTRLALQH